MQGRAGTRTSSGLPPPLWQSCQLPAGDSVTSTHAACQPVPGVACVLPTSERACPSRGRTAQRSRTTRPTEAPALDGSHGTRTVGRESSWSTPHRDTLRHLCTPPLHACEASHLLCLCPHLPQQDRRAELGEHRLVPGVQAVEERARAGVVAGAHDRDVAPCLCDGGSQLQVAGGQGGVLVVQRLQTLHRLSWGGAGTKPKPASLVLSCLSDGWLRLGHKLCSTVLGADAGCSPAREATEQIESSSAMVLSAGSVSWICEETV